MASTIACVALFLVLGLSAPSLADAAAFDIGDFFTPRKAKQFYDKWKSWDREVKAIAEAGQLATVKPEQVEGDRVKVSSVRNSNEFMLDLTEATWATTVMKENSQVEHWVVKFCVDSQQCKAMDNEYKELSAKYTKTLNFNMFATLPIRFSNKVRFAQVDCTSETQLCADQGVMSYPSIMHVHRKGLGELKPKFPIVTTWQGHVRSFAPWLEQELTGKVAAVTAAVDGEVQPSALTPEPAEAPVTTDSEETPLTMLEQAKLQAKAALTGLLGREDEVARAARTALMALTLALAASLWRFVGGQPAPPTAPKEEASLATGSQEMPLSQQVYLPPAPPARPTIELPKETAPSWSGETIEL